jgi:hypothetical protein
MIPVVAVMAPPPPVVMMTVMTIVPVMAPVGLLHETGRVGMKCAQRRRSSSLRRECAQTQGHGPGQGRKQCVA